MMISSYLAMILGTQHFIIDELKQMRRQMSDAQTSLDTLNTKVDGLTKTVTDGVTDLDALKAEVDSLKSQIGSGSPITAAQLDAISAKIDSAQSNLAGAVGRDQADPQPQA